MEFTTVKLLFAGQAQIESKSTTCHAHLILQLDCWMDEDVRGTNRNVFGTILNYTDVDMKYSLVCKTD